MSPLGRAINAIEAGYWIYEHYPAIEAYLDGPKTLEELHRAVSKPKAGYDIHHIVEKAPAAQDGYSANMIEAPGNLVRITTLPRKSACATRKPFGGPERR